MKPQNTGVSDVLNSSLSNADILLIYLAGKESAKSVARLFKLRQGPNSDAEAAKDLEQAVTRNTYTNNPDTVPTDSYSPLYLRSVFSKQSALGKPVKPGKIYPNLFFTNLVTIHFFHTYISGWLTWGFQGGIGKQFTSAEKKQFKTYKDETGLYQIRNQQKHYIEDGDYRYIVSPKGGLYILTIFEFNCFHNSIRASEPVQCAGQVAVKSKQIKMIGNASGHYRPTYQQLLRTVGGLYAAGFIGPNVKIRAFIMTGFFSNHDQWMGTVAELIKQDKIKIPMPWTATPSFSLKMR